MKEIRIDFDIYMAEQREIEEEASEDGFASGKECGYEEAIEYIINFIENGESLSEDPLPNEILLMSLISKLKREEKSL